MAVTVTIWDGIFLQMLQRPPSGRARAGVGQQREWGRDRGEVAAAFAGKSLSQKEKPGKSPVRSAIVAHNLLLSGALARDGHEWNGLVNHSTEE